MRKATYNRARYYDAKVGRWISEDPIGFAAGDYNLSRYVANSPTNATDPSGLAAWPQHHWFMKHHRRSGVGQNMVDEKCPCGSINIDHYTTVFTPQEHNFIHNGPYPYHYMYDKVRLASTNCCDFLLGVWGLMKFYEAAVAIQHNQGKITDGWGPIFDLKTWKQPDGPSNLNLFRAKVKQFCGNDAEPNWREIYKEELLDLKTIRVTGYPGQGVEEIIGVPVLPGLLPGGPIKIPGGPIKLPLPAA